MCVFFPHHHNLFILVSQLFNITQMLMTCMLMPKYGHFTLTRQHCNHSKNNTEWLRPGTAVSTAPIISLNPPKTFMTGTHETFCGREGEA